MIFYFQQIMDSPEVAKYVPKSPVPPHPAFSNDGVLYTIVHSQNQEINTAEYN